jgi:acyl-CoA synthetase (AMP-forming)/AMP-acid ligase II
MTTHTAHGLQWTDDPLWTQFEAHARAAPDAPALFTPDGRGWSRGELAQEATAAAEALRAQGVQAGDRVMFEARKTVSTATTALALSRLGAILCPFAPDLGRAEREVLQQRLNHIALIDGSGTQWCDRATLQARDPRDAAAALIGFTSGTTGVPKGVMHTSAAMNYATGACAHVAGLAPGDAIAGLVPLASAPGFTFSVHFAFALGHPLALVDPWDAATALRTIERHACRWAMCVPTQLTAMIDAAGAQPSASPLRALAVGGSSMTAELVARAEIELGIRALRMFGMSECMGHASTSPSDPIALRRTSDGVPFPGTEVEAFDAELRPLPRGQRGQAGVRGPSLFIGYCKGLGEHEARFTPSGHFLTGDEIVRDTDGHVRVVGRIKDQIIRGGYNIDPAEVEAALLRHPAIAAVALVGVPERRLGEQACAVCRLREDQPAPTLEDLKQHLAELGLSKKKWPEHLLIVGALPLTATGKVDKKQLARLAAGGLAAR